MIWMLGIWDGRKHGIWQRIEEGGGELLKEVLMVERLTRHNRPFDDYDDDDDDDDDKEEGFPDLCVLAPC